MKPKAKDWGDFEDVADNPMRLIVRSYGPQKVGKNHFGFTGPAPIAGLYFDPGGVEGVVQKFVRGEVDGFEPKEIKTRTFRFDKHGMGQSEAQDVRGEFEESYAIALRNARLIQIDESELWSLYRWAEFGQDSDAPKEYAELYARYRSLIQDAVDANVNLQLIQKTKEKWVNVIKKKKDQNGQVREVEVGAPSGDFEPYGMKEVPYLVQVNLRHGWTKPEGFSIYVEDCRQNMGIAGEAFGNATWAELGQYVFPDSKEGDWE